MKFVRFFSLSLLLVICSGSLFSQVASPKIIGGVAADNGEHDYFVSLFRAFNWDSKNTTLSPTSDGYSWKSFCGGSYIGNRTIITAAHCVSDLPPTGDLHVLVGNYSQSGMYYEYCTSYTASDYYCEGYSQPYFSIPGLSYTGYAIYLGDESELRTVPVENIRVHPWYNEITFDYDIAILTIQQTINNNYLNLPSTDLFSSLALEGSTGNVQAIGHGDMIDDEDSRTFSASAQLLEVDLTARTDAACEDALGLLFNRSNMICAGDDGKDTKQGDSGGPLIDPIADTLLGVTSWGLETCRDSSACYGVYTDVYEFTSWIESDGVFVVPIVEKNADGELLRMGRTAGAFGGLFGFLFTLLLIRKRHEN